MVAIFKEVVSDVTERKDVHTILAIASLVIALILISIGASSNSLFNFIMVMNIALSGWLLNTGWTAKKHGDKPKLLVLAAIALALSALQIWQFCSIFAQVAQAGESMRNMRQMFKP